MKQPALFLLLLHILFFPVSTSACLPVNTEDHPSGLICMSELVTDRNLSKKELRTLQKEEKKRIRMEHRLEKFQKLLHSRYDQAKSGIFSDPVGRWFWIWVISWGFGILLFAISGGAIGTFVGVLLLTAFVIGSIALVVWLKKQFS
jgi:hypothetical protein